MPSTGFTLFFALTVVAQLCRAHQSPWMPSMYGMNTDVSGWVPIGPDWDFDDWWFRGAPTRNSPPADGAVSILPAGGTLMLEIACNIAWTTYGVSPTKNISCPGNVGAYHSGDPSAATIDQSLVAGCALAIADVERIEDVTVDNLAIFTVQADCVSHKDTVFQIPAKMPPCTGEYCMCAWMWEPQNGTGNYYQTPFRCDVTGSPVDATPISMPLVDPVFCPNGGCATGAKRPIYFYNNDYSNIQWVDNYHRPGYHSSWSFNNGPQNDIFMTAAQAAAYVRPALSAPVAKSNYTYPLNTNLASQATATASSVDIGSSAAAAIDGIISGYVNPGPDGNETAEWSSHGEQQGAWLKLTWPTPITTNLVVMYDRPNWNDFCKGGNLTFSDGSIVNFTQLDNGGAASPVSFAAKTTTSILWTCGKVSAWTSNVGLAEIQVYGPSGLNTPSSSAAAASTSSSPVVIVSSSATTAKLSSTTTSRTSIQISSSTSSPVSSPSSSSSRSSANLSPSSSPAASPSSSPVASASFPLASSSVAPSSSASPSSSAAIYSSSPAYSSPAYSSPAASTQSSSTVPTPSSSTLAASSSQIPSPAYSSPSASSSTGASPSSSVPASSSPLASSPMASSSPLPSSSTYSTTTSQSVAPSSSTTARTSVTLSSSVTSSSPTTSPVASQVPASVLVVAGQSSSTSSSSSSVPTSSSRVSTTTTTTTTSVKTTTTTSVTATQSPAGTYSSINLVFDATLKASSQDTADGSYAYRAQDGIIGGYTDDQTGDSTAEWSSNHGVANSYMLLTWTSAVEIAKVNLYDRPNAEDQCLASTLKFSNGAVIQVGTLPNDGSIFTVTFAPVSTTTLTWTCTKVTASTSNIGLSEIQAYALASSASANGLNPINWARYATATSSSTTYQSGPEKAIDNQIGGYTTKASTSDQSKEWVSNGEGIGAWLNLAWSSPVSVSKVVLYDRPNLNDQIWNSTLTFSDGTVIAVPTLINNGGANTITLPRKVVTTSIRLSVTDVSSPTTNVGLSEIQVYGSSSASKRSIDEPVEEVKVHARDWRARAKALPRDKREALSARQAEERRRQLMADSAHNRPADF